MQVSSFSFFFGGVFLERIYNRENIKFCNYFKDDDGCVHYKRGCERDTCAFYECDPNRLIKKLRKWFAFIVNK